MGDCHFLPGCWQLQLAAPVVCLFLPFSQLSTNIRTFLPGVRQVPVSVRIRRYLPATPGRMECLFRGTPQVQGSPSQLPTHTTFPFHGEAKRHARVRDVVAGWQKSKEKKTEPDFWRVCPLEELPVRCNGPLFPAKLFSLGPSVGSANSQNGQGRLPPASTWNWEGACHCHRGS